jgi:hypothetical protein
MRKTRACSRLSSGRFGRSGIVPPIRLLDQRRVLPGSEVVVDGGELADQAIQGCHGTIAFPEIGHHGRWL